MTLRLVSRSLATFASLAVVSLTSGSASAQVVGENVNMVSGTQWPGGDPFLQRQNEPTMAVSSVNSQHLMAGANDYRSVDVPDPAFGKMAAGDAWLGVFKSLDGGQTWKSVLLPGYPQDTSPEGTKSPLKTTLVVPKTFLDDPTKWNKAVKLPGCADPVMRAGTDGMFYYLGINFARDKSVSRLFLGRFIDQNNKENGDATKTVVVNGVPVVQPTDPIRYLDTQIIARSTDTGLNGGKHIFIDKPWMAVDVPRSNSQTCTVPDPDKPATATKPQGTKQILAGTVYVGWAQFAPGDVSSDIMLTWSNDCGKSWATPRKLNTVNSLVNQGVAIAIEPLTGRLFVSWRRVASGTQTDAIMATRSNGRRKQFSGPRDIAQLVPFDLGTGSGQARTQTMPSMTISSDGTSSYAHVAWASRDGAGGPSKIWMTTAKIYPPPVGDQDPDEPDDYENETRVRWTPAAKVSVGDLDPADDKGHVLTHGHQYMPALTASQGRLVLFYYDSRYDHTRRYYTPNALVSDPADLTGKNKIWPPDSKGKFYQEELGPIGDLVDPGSPAYANVFGNTPGADFNDEALLGTRHTIDVRVGMGLPGLAPSFSSVLVSRFPLGMTGLETNVVYPETTPRSFLAMTAAGFFTPAPATPTSPPLVVTDPAPEPGAITIVPADKSEVQVLQQLQLNAPGYPMFKGSSAAFMGDYIDVQGQNFVMTPKGWAFNMGATLAPVFHAVWTSNQDVKAPPYSLVDNKPDWKLYTPVTLWIAGSRPGFPASSPLQKGMLFDGGRTSPNISNPNISNTAPIAVCDPATTGSRDQNIYTARITEGLQISTPQNAKFLNGQVPVGFVIAAANSTSKQMTVTFGAPTGVATGNFSYTTDFAAAVTSVTNVQIAPYSSVYRTLFVRQGTSLNSAPTILVTVSETGCSACRAGSLTFNPPVALSSLVAPDGATAPGTAGELYAATIGAPNISNPNISNPNISNPNISNPNISNPNISNPNISNPNISNPNISNPNISNPNISNPNISNPNISNPNISNPNISNSAISDANYTFTNSGNTTASYFVKIVGDISKAPKPLQLIVSKTYKTPSAVGCDLKEVAHDQLVVSVPDVSGAIVDPNTAVSTGVSSPNISNATLSLAPGESATVTLRGYNIPLAEMAKVASSFTPAPVPAAVPPSNTVTYQNWGSPGSGTGNKPFVKTATSTSLAIVNGAYVATVTPATGATGTVSFIVGAQVLKVAPVVSGAAGFTPAAPLAPAEVMVAYFSGDATYAASSSNAVSGLAAAKIYINAAISGVDGIVNVSDATGAALAGAHVQIDQTFDTVPHSYSGLTGVGGFYSLPSHPTDPWPAGSTVTVTVSSGNSVVTSQGILPGVASIATPNAGASVPVDQDIAVSWTGTFPGPSTEFYLRAWFGNGLNGATARVADVSTLSFTANSFPAGLLLDLYVYSLHMPLVTGDVAPYSVLELYAFSAKRTVNTIATALAVPGAPTGLSATPGNTTASLSWTAPSSNGGSPVTGYVVAISPATVGASAAVLGTGASVTGLTNGTPYTFTVAATNVVGTGPASAASSPITPSAPVTAPGAPSGVTATPGNTTASLTWVAPESNGGSPITGYVVAISPATVGASAAVLGTGASATGLTNGTPYTFTVAATNVVGTGPASAASSPVTPTAPATASGSLVTARVGHTAIALGGSVYSIGGTDLSGNYLNSVERYDPTTNTSTQVATMNSARTMFGAAEANGKIYVFGGMPASGTYTATTEEYDPGTGAWTAKAPMPIARAYLRGAYVNKGTPATSFICAVGGFTDPDLSGVAKNGRIDCYDPATNQWTARGYMPRPRALFALGASGGMLYAMGGYSTGIGGAIETTVDTIETTNWWMATSSGSSLSPLGSGVTAVPLTDGSFFTLGGNWAPNLMETYFPLAPTAWAQPSGTWATLHPFNVYYPGVATTDGSTVVVTGGWQWPGSTPVSTITKFTAPVTVAVWPESVTLLPGQSQSFIAKVSGTANTAVTWFSPTAGALTSGGNFTAPATTGTHSVQARSVAAVTEVASATVTVAATLPGPAALPPMNTPRTGHAVVAAAGKIYAIGGTSNGATLLSSVEVFDTANPAAGWIYGPQLTQGRYEAAAVVWQRGVNDYTIYVFGGYTPPYYTGTSAVFGSWEELPVTASGWTLGTTSMASARGGHQAVVANDASASSAWGPILILGGSGSNGSSLTNVEVFNPGPISGGSFGASTVPAASVPRATFSVVKRRWPTNLGGGSDVWLMGGDSTLGVTNSVEILSIPDAAPSSGPWGSWSASPYTTPGVDLAIVGTPRLGLTQTGSALLGNKIYLFGGTLAGRTVQAGAYVLDLAAQSPAWTPSTPLSEAKANCGAAVVNGVVYVLGGDRGGWNVSSVIEKLVP